MSEIEKRLYTEGAHQVESQDRGEQATAYFINEHAPHFSVSPLAALHITLSVCFNAVYADT
jgi:hypothetical protein